MIFKTFSGALAGVALVLTTGFAPAANAAETPQTILSKVQVLNMMEIDAGSMGAVKGCGGFTKQYGQKLAADHQAAYNATAAFAAQNSVTLVANPTPKNTWEAQNRANMVATIKTLGALTDCTFDKQYLTAMRDAHAFAIQLVKEAMADLKGSATAFFLCDQILPSLQLHYEMAVKLLAECYGGSTTQKSCP